MFNEYDYKEYLKKYIDYLDNCNIELLKGNIDFNEYIQLLYKSINEDFHMYYGMLNLVKSCDIYNLFNLLMIMSFICDVIDYYKCYQDIINRTMFLNKLKSIIDRHGVNINLGCVY